MSFSETSSNSKTATANTLVNVTSKFEKSLVKSLSELFSREDKQSIRVFKGRPSDPPITTWLKEAEITAYLNEWDDEQKVRYFSDRLKDEAAEWLREYINNEGDLEYNVWKDALIARFRNETDIEQDADDNNQTDTLLKDVKRMRDDAKLKILFRGLLPKISNRALATGHRGSFV